MTISVVPIDPVTGTRAESVTQISSTTVLDFGGGLAAGVVPVEPLPAIPARSVALYELRDE